MNKGRIQGELRYFWGILWNLTKSNDEMRWEIRDFDIIGKKTWRRIHGIKNNWIWIKIRGEIDVRIKEKFLKEKIAKKQN